MSNGKENPGWEGVVIAGLFDLAKLFLQASYTTAAMAKATPEQFAAMAAEEHAKFLANKPEDLPDV